MNLLLILSAAVALSVAVLYLPLLNSPRLFNFTLNGGVSSSNSGAEPFAELLLQNGVIFTSDASVPFADSMAVSNGKILRIGNYSSLQGLIGNETELLNLEGKVVVPGFIDSHVHFIPGGLQMARVKLHGVRQKEEFVRRIEEAVKNAKQGSWVLGGGWNNDMWGGELPMASWLDDFSADNPVWLSRMDGHMGLANSLALKLAGISKLSEDPSGGTIMKTPSGEPTGLLVDAAMKLILAHIPEVSVTQRREALLRATDLALTRGVTSVVDFGRYFPGVSPEDPWEDLSGLAVNLLSLLNESSILILRPITLYMRLLASKFNNLNVGMTSSPRTNVYQWADYSGQLRTRMCMFFPMETWSRLADVMKKNGRALSDRIYLGGVKAFADGSLGSNSALFYEPYVGEPQNTGLQLIDMKSLFNMTAASDKFGLQVAIHAIGDKANDMVLEVYKSVVSTNGNRDRRFRIEHAQHLAPGAANQFGEQQIFASIQPDHLLDDADTASKKLGTERAQTGSYLFHSLLDSNTPLALGSDWPVADINPLGSIRTAMKRIPPGWETAWNPAECLSLTDALIAHTISAAEACFLDEYVGSLSPGKLADFVILSAESWEKFEEEGAASVEATYLGGVKAYP
ncbi:Protein LONG AFTER FAR-RED 3 [Linum grandiflorum]